MAKRVTDLERRFPTLQVFKQKEFDLDNPSLPLPSCIISWKTKLYVNYALFLNGQFRETEHLARGYKPAKR